MLSDRQKSVLFKTKIVSKPRYVRVPLQMYNGVRELKTDVYFPRLLQQYKQNIELMQRLLPDERICHLRAVTQRLEYAPILSVAALIS